MVPPEGQPPQLWETLHFKVHIKTCSTDQVLSSPFLYTDLRTVYIWCLWHFLDLQLCVGYKMYILNCNRVSYTQSVTNNISLMEIFTEYLIDMIAILLRCLCTIHGLFTWYRIASVENTIKSTDTKQQWNKDSYIFWDISANLFYSLQQCRPGLYFPIHTKISPITLQILLQFLRPIPLKITHMLYHGPWWLYMWS